jgi:predicted O-methyltransferase YrrM
MKIFEVSNEISRSRKVRRIIRNLCNLLITTRIPLKLAAVMLRHNASKCNKTENYVDLAFNIFNDFRFRPWTIKPAQIREEITELVKVLAKRKPKLLLEIGTARGGTLFLFTRVSSSNALIISVDLPGGRFGGGYPEWRKLFYESFAIHKQKMHLIRADSHALSTLNMVENILEGYKLDFLFIDGDHTYKGVKTDFEMYSKLVGKGGIIAFHDVCPHPPHTECEVNLFWHEIKDKYEHIEIVRDWKQGWAGIGVLYV